MSMASILFTALLLQPPVLATSAPPLAEAARRASQAAEAAGLAGEIVITDASGEQVDLALGAADREQKRAHRAGQQWIWASVTKQVTALLVMQEVERGRLDLEAPLGRYLPEYGGNRDITIRQLLQHRSGLPNPDDTPSTDETMPAFYLETGAGISDGARAAGYCAQRKSAAGEDFRYNNCDYLVLGALLQKVTGHNFGALVEERLAKPLRLRSLRMARDGAAGGSAISVGYLGTKRFPPVNVATFGASGALTGTARDLATFDRALMNGTLLSTEARATLWQGDPKLGYQALGAWAFSTPLKGCAAPVRLLERRGDVGGTQVRNVIAPELGRAVIVFTNDAQLDFGEIWQAKGLSYDMLSAALCSATPPAAK